MRFRLDITPVVQGDRYEVSLSEDKLIDLSFRMIDDGFWIVEVRENEELTLTRRILSNVDIFGGTSGVYSGDGKPYTIVIDDVSRIESDGTFVLDIGVP